jgi:hypothetical protein
MNFNKRVHEVLEELENIATGEWQKRLFREWFKANFEVMHVEHSISDEMMEYARDKAVIKHYEERDSVTKLAREGLLPISVITDDVTPRNERTNEKLLPSTTTRFSVIAMRKERRNEDSNY